MHRILLNAQGHQLEQLQRHLLETVQTWCNDWDFAKVQSCVVDRTSAKEHCLIDGRWTELSPEGIYIGSASHSNVKAAVLALAFAQHDPSDSKTSPVARFLADRSINDLVQRLWILFRQTVPTPQPSFDYGSCPVPVRLHSRWSGASLAQITWGNVSFMLCIGPELLAALAPADPKQRPTKVERQPLVPLTTALANRNVTHRVEFSPQAVCLDDLISMQVGDVLKTEHMLGQPALLRCSSGQTILCGELGQVDGQYAVRITSVSAAVN